MEENSWCDERYGDCCGSTSRFESMLRLLMFLETELEFKEEVIDLLLEDEQVQEILNKKLIQLNRRERGDPALALGRDKVYDKELWETHFQNWGKSADPSFDHVVSSNGGHLGAVAAMRTIEVASKLHQKYVSTYRNLEKAARSYKKMKYKLSRQQQDDKPPAIVELPSATHDTLAKLEKQVSDLQEEIALERQRNAALQKKIKTLTSSATKERKKCMKVIRFLAERVERLNAQVARTSPNGHLPNGKNGLNVIKMAPDDGDSNPWRPMGLNGAALSDDNV